MTPADTIPTSLEAATQGLATLWKALGPEGGTAATVALFALALASVVALDYRAARLRRLEARVDSFVLRRSDAEGLAAVTSRLSQGLAAVVGPGLAALGRALFSRERDRAEMRSLLRAAGVRHEHALSIFAAAKAGLMASAAVAAHFALGKLAPDLGAVQHYTLIGGAAFAGSVAPEMVLRAMRDARRRALQESLPDVIDLLVIAADGGQSLDMAMSRVATELMEFWPDIAGELHATLAEMQALPDRAEALRNFGERLDTREARAFAMTLAQSTRYGTPFSAALKTLGQDLKQARVLALEERGAKLPALLSLPLIIFILPAVFIVVLGPAVLSLSEMFNAS
jgi:tight adherence protein C